MSGAPRRPGTEGYEEAADALAIQYESINPDKLFDGFAHLLPEPGAQVADIGAGTGRDAAALARLGYRVLAVEPTASLRAHGARLHADVAIDWLDDGLPDLAATRATGRLFDFVLLRAVWMHLDAAERAAAMPNLAGLLRPGGRALLALRHGPVPAGRRMFDVSGDETAALAAASGLTEIYRQRHKDLQDRADVSWTYIAFRR